MRQQLVKEEVENRTTDFFDRSDGPSSNGVEPTPTRNALYGTYE